MNVPLVIVKLGITSKFSSTWKRSKVFFWCPSSNSLQSSVNGPASH